MFTKISLASIASAAVLAALPLSSALGGEAQYEYPQPIVSTKSRAAVRAEAIEAARLGLTPRGEFVPVATPAQLEQIRLAGVRAEAALTASAR